MAVICTLVPYLNCCEPMPLNPLLTFFTRMATTWLVRFWPKPRAAGVMATICVGVTETTVASTPLKLLALVPMPNSTCTGDWKPVPVMVTRVPPSLVPEAGLTAKIAGWPPPPPPTEQVKPRSIVAGWGSGWLTWLAPVTETGEVWPTGTGAPAAAAEGVTTTIWLELTERTVAAAPPKVTRTGWAKPPPRMVTVWPPAASPVFGETEETKKVAAELMRTLTAPVAPPKVAVTAAVPTSAPLNRLAWARPLTSPSVRLVTPLFAELKVPSVVVIVTCEPSAGGWPLSVWRTSTVMVLEPTLPAVMLGGLAVTDTV